MTPDEIQALADKVNALAPPVRLRLAADLMERQRADTALLIIKRVADELQLALLLAKSDSDVVRGRGKR